MQTCSFFRSAAAFSTTPGPSCAFLEGPEAVDLPSPCRPCRGEEGLALVYPLFDTATGEDGLMAVPPAVAYRLLVTVPMPVYPGLAGRGVEAPAGPVAAPGPAWPGLARLLDAPGVAMA